MLAGHAAALQHTVLTLALRCVRPQLQNFARARATNAVSGELVEEKRHAATQLITLDRVVPLGILLRVPRLETRDASTKRGLQTLDVWLAPGRETAALAVEKPGSMYMYEVRPQWLRVSPNVHVLDARRRCRAPA